MAQLLQHVLQGWQPPVGTSISQCPVLMRLQPWGFLTASSPIPCLSPACATAAVPLLLWQPTQAPTLSTDNTRESNLLPSMLISRIKQRGTFLFIECRWMALSWLWEQPPDPTLGTAAGREPAAAAIYCLGSLSAGRSPQPREKMTHSTPL